MSITSEIDQIHKKIQRLSECKLRILLVNFFHKAFGAEADLYHSTVEYGADIIVSIKDEDDILGLEQALMIQVKSGEVTHREWKKNLCTQMAELYYRRYDMPNSSKLSPRRIIILVTNGSIQAHAKTAIDSWNSKLPIPVEVLDGWRLSKLLHYNRFMSRDLTELLKPLAFTPSTPRPRRELPKVKKVGES